MEKEILSFAKLNWFEAIEFTNLSTSVSFISQEFELEKKIFEEGNSKIPEIFLKFSKLRDSFKKVSPFLEKIDELMQSLSGIKVPVKFEVSPQSFHIYLTESTFLETLKENMTKILKKNEGFVVKNEDKIGIRNQAYVLDIMDNGLNEKQPFLLADKFNKHQSPSPKNKSESNFGQNKGIGKSKEKLNLQKNQNSHDRISAFAFEEQNTQKKKDDLRDNRQNQKALKIENIQPKKSNEKFQETNDFEQQVDKFQNNTKDSKNQTGIDNQFCRFMTFSKIHQETNNDEISELEKLKTENKIIKLEVQNFLTEKTPNFEENSFVQNSFRSEILGNTSREFCRKTILLMDKVEEEGIQLSEIGNEGLSKGGKLEKNEREIINLNLSQNQIHRECKIENNEPMNLNNSNDDIVQIDKLNQSKDQLVRFNYSLKNNEIIQAHKNKEYGKGHVKNPLDLNEQKHAQKEIRHQLNTSKNNTSTDIIGTINTEQMMTQSLQSKTSQHKEYCANQDSTTDRNYGRNDLIQINDLKMINNCSKTRLVLLSNFDVNKNSPRDDSKNSIRQCNQFNPDQNNEQDTVVLINNADIEQKYCRNSLLITNTLTINQNTTQNNLIESNLKTTNHQSRRENLVLLNNQTINFSPSKATLSPLLIQEEREFVARPTIHFDNNSKEVAPKTKHAAKINMISVKSSSNDFKKTKNNVEIQKNTSRDFSKFVFIENAKVTKKSAKQIASKTEIFDNGKKTRVNLVIDSLKQQSNQQIDSNRLENEINSTNNGDNQIKSILKPKRIDNGIEIYSKNDGQNSPTSKNLINNSEKREHEGIHFQIQINYKTNFLGH